MRLGAAQGLFGLGQGRLAIIQLSRQRLDGGFFGSESLAQCVQLVGTAARAQHRGFRIENLAALQRLMHLAFQIVDAGTLDFGGLGGFSLTAIEQIGTTLPLRQRAFRCRQRFAAFFGSIGQRIEPGLFALQCLLQHLLLLAVQPALLAQMLMLAGQIGQFALEASYAVAAEIQLLLDTGNLRAHLIVLGLDRTKSLGGLAVLGACGLDISLVAGLIRGELFHQQFGLSQFGNLGLQLLRQRPPGQGLGLGIHLALFRAQFGPALGLLGLSAQMLQMFVDLVADVFQTFQILARGAHARLGFLAPLLVLGDTGGFFEMHAQVFGRRFDDLRDHALLDDRV